MRNTNGWAARVARETRVTEIMDRRKRAGKAPVPLTLNFFVS